MNKQNFINAVADKAKISKKDAGSCVDAVLDVIVETLKQGEEVAFLGFGTFECKKRAARTGLNPATKEKINIPATVVPTFKAGKTFKEAVAKVKI